MHILVIGEDEEAQFPHMPHELPRGITIRDSSHIIIGHVGVGRLSRHLQEEIGAVLILGIQHSHQLTHETLLDLEAHYGKDICMVMAGPIICSMEEIACREQERPRSCKGEAPLLFQLSALPITHEIKLDLPREPRLDPQAKKFHLHQTPPTQKKLGKPSKGYQQRRK